MFVRKKRFEAVEKELRSLIVRLKNEVNYLKEKQNADVILLLKDAHSLGLEVDHVGYDQFYLTSDPDWPIIFSRQQMTNRVLGEKAKRFDIHSKKKRGKK